MEGKDLPHRLVLFLDTGVLSQGDIVSISQSSFLLSELILLPPHSSAVILSPRFTAHREGEKICSLQQGHQLLHPAPRPKQSFLQTLHSLKEGVIAIKGPVC